MGLASWQGSNVCSGSNSLQVLMLEMAYVMGEHYLFLFTSIIHCWHYGPLGGGYDVPHVMLCLLAFDLIIWEERLMMTIDIVAMWLLQRVGLFPHVHNVAY